MQTKHKLLPRPQMHQVISFKQQQELKVLEMNSAELSMYIEEELESNPLLEQDMSFETGYITKCEQNFELLLNYVVREKTLSEVIQEQIHQYRGPILVDLAVFLADMLDDNGYLRYTDDELLRYFPNYDRTALHETISILQTFEPKGVCARSLQECLLLQLKERTESIVPLARRILSEHLTELAENKIKLIADHLNCSLLEVQDAVTMIRNLQPKPGAGYSSTASYLHPDVYVSVNGREVHIELLNQTYGLYLNSDKYCNLDELEDWLSPYYQRAKQLLSNIEKRNQTPLNVVMEIFRKQDGYFLDGMSLQPCTMKQIASKLGVHESTISRCINGKSMVFHRQVIPLKYFFPKTLEQEDVQILYLAIKNIIQKEDKKKPYSDQAICDLLNKQGHVISRRTVTKYREQLGFPSTSKRKQFLK